MIAEMAPNLKSGPILEAASLHPLSVCELPLGGKLACPLNNQGGGQLLPAGAIITPLVLQALRQRQVTTVWIHSSDLASLGNFARPEAKSDDASPQKIDVHTHSTQKLDREVYRPHALDIVQTGPAFADSFQTAGPSIYDDQMVSEVARLHDSSCLKVNSMLDALQSIQKSSRAGLKDGASVANSYMGYMKRDLDVVLARVQLPEEKEYLVRHCLELGVLGMAIASRLQMDERNVLVVGLTGLVHDVGMTRVPKAICELPRRLNSREYYEVMKHVVYSADILERTEGLPMVIRVATYQVHERFNGSGYPRGRSRSQIHLFARILAAADAYLALTSPRPYRRALLPYTAMEAMVQQTGRGLFDPDIVRALLQTLSLFPIGSFVILSDNRAAKVIRSNTQEYDRPIVEIVCDPEGRLVSKGQVVDLATDRGLKVVQAIGAPSQN